ncbi:uncharacterized protein I206_104178 [Kwoniella pini CBS 10737]|uniref:RING-type E3 ubiquitin transferase (cysteine targeting) n=1 Tax=Kwoniella pini CBS 10737 TaxID=1296096 RepID=A0A1B9I2F7_9TREE|nr:uncharacterized protein I206_04247 [Kwoniella pini CBS 10737]OCF49723.1 hypothetical protein I206_04247 [Kwoniella pini CBS 10737]
MASPQRIIYPGESPSESSSSISMIIPLNAPKVNQIDSDDLDSALVEMMSDNLTKSLDNFKLTFSNGFRPEIELLIQLIIFKFGIWSSINASPGLKMQNMKLISSKTINPTKKILILYLLLHPPIFPRYFLNRIREYALSKQWSDLPNYDLRKKAWRLIGRLENLSRIWELIGWLGFLYDGKYPSLLMRILQLKLVPAKPHLARMVGYEFMNRQLVWGTFTEFLMFAIPLLPPFPPYLSPSAHLNRMRSLLSPPQKIDYSTIKSQPMANGIHSQRHKGIYADLPLSTCPICHSRNITAPVPLSSSAQGSGLNLPPIEGAGGFGHELDSDENKIFVPAQTDCKGGCRWCYYCIGEELFKHNERVKAYKTSTKKLESKKDAASVQQKDLREKNKIIQEDNQNEEEEKWECLRCGDGVSRAWRVGTEDGNALI